MSDQLPTNIDRLDQALLNLPLNESFFVEGETPEKLGIVRRRGYQLGIKLEIRLIIDDEIFRGKSGSRVWNRGPLKPKAGTDETTDT